MENKMDQPKPKPKPKKPDNVAIVPPEYTDVVNDDAVVFAAQYTFLSRFAGAGLQFRSSLTIGERDYAISVSEMLDEIIVQELPSQTLLSNHSLTFSKLDREYQDELAVIEGVKSAYEALKERADGLEALRRTYSEYISGMDTLEINNDSRALQLSEQIEKEEKEMGNYEEFFDVYKEQIEGAEKVIAEIDQKKSELVFPKAALPVTFKVSDLAEKFS